MRLNAEQPERRNRNYIRTFCLLNAKGKMKSKQWILSTVISVCVSFINCINTRLFIIYDCCYCLFVCKYLCDIWHRPPSYLSFFFYSWTACEYMRERQAKWKLFINFVCRDIGFETQVQLFAIRILHACWRHACHIFIFVSSFRSLPSTQRRQFCSIHFEIEFSRHPLCTKSSRWVLDTPRERERKSAHQFMRKSTNE